MASTDEKIFNGKDLETYSTLIKQSIENVENQIPTLTSLLINNSNFVADANYVHTDNNYTSQEKTKLSGIEAGAEVNVLSDWNAVSGDAFIKNKPNNIVTDASYVHTDNNYTTVEKNKLAGIASGAEVNVQSDWNQTTTTADDYIKNKPTNVSSFNNDAGYLTEHQDISGKLDVITDLDTIRAGAALGSTAYQKPSTGIPKSDLAQSVQTSLGKADTALQQHQDLSSYADGAEYDSTNHLIYLKHGNTRLANPINANDFIKDGMVDTVTVTGGNLVITFNTDSGKLPITIPISDIFDANNYYNKTESDARYLLSFTETDPIFSASPAAGITSSDIDYWDNKLNKITPPVVGSLYRNDVSGSGGISIRGTKGLFPTVTSADTYTVITKMLSSTQSYGLSVNFGGNTYTLNTTNGLIEDTRQITVNAGATWSGSVVGNVAANTILDVKLFSSLDEITTVGMTAITNSYNDLDNKPTIPAVYSGKLTIQKNGTQVATFTANQSSNATANITVPTKVSELDNDSGFITGYTETDPTVPSWAKQSTKPSYTASEVGALPSTTFIPSKTSDLTNDSGFITGYTETDPIYSASAAAGITSSDITAWNNKQNALTFDTAPTASSTNPVTSGGVKTALDAKQATLVSGTSIKTVNNTSLLGSGNVAVQPTLVSGTNIKTVNSTSLLGSGNVSVQPTLVSGTNIKTINNESLLGSGNISIQGGGSDWNISVNNNILTISNQN